MEAFKFWGSPEKLFPRAILTAAVVAPLKSMYSIFSIASPSHTSCCTDVAGEILTKSASGFICIEPDKVLELQLLPKVVTVYLWSSV